MSINDHLTALAEVIGLTSRGGSIEDPKVNLTAAELHAYLHGDGDSMAGVKINRAEALKLSAYYRCVALISESIASIPLHVYQRTESGNRKARQPAPTHAVEKLVAKKPNEYLNSFYWRETAQSHTLMTGKSCALIIRNNRSDPLELRPLMPDSVEPQRLRSGRVVWHVFEDSGRFTVENDDMLVIPGLGFDGMQGYSPIQKMATTLGLGLAAERFGAKFFGNGAHPKGVLEHPKNISTPAAERLTADWSRKYGGENTHKTAILEEGMQYKAISMPNDQAQFLQTREFSVTDIARWFGIPPNMIGDNKFSTFNNSENQSINFVRYTLRPWFVRWESEINEKLFPTTNDDEYFVSFTADALLRGTTRERYASYAVGRQWGWLSANDIRQWEHMPPQDGLDGYLVPLNMVDATNAGKDLDEEIEKDEEAEAIKAGRALADEYSDPDSPGHEQFNDLVEAVAERQAKFESKMISIRCKKDNPDEEIRDFWGQLPEILERNCGYSADLAKCSVDAVVEKLTQSPESIDTYVEWRTEILKTEMGL